MAVTMAATGMARLIFRQFISLKEQDVFGDGPFACLEYAHSGAIEFMQRAPADAAYHYGIHLMAAKPCYRIAGPMLMDPVAVVDRRYFVGDHVHHDKPRCRPEMPEHLTL